MVLVTKQKQKKLTTHDKRIHGLHQKQSKHYAKTYWPYLPVIVLFATGFAINTHFNAISSTTGSISSASLLSQTNTNRTIPLQENTVLSNLAQDAADNIAISAQQTKNIINSDVNGSINNQIENIAYGFGASNDVVSGWMNSAANRSNILRSGINSVGFGIARTSNNPDGKSVVVAVYGNSTSPATAQTSSPMTAVRPETVARIQILTGGYAPWSLAVVLILIATAGAIVAFKHGLALRKLISQGERYAIKNPWVDLLFLGIVFVGFELTRAAGVIF